MPFFLKRRALNAKGAASSTELEAIEAWTVIGERVWMPKRRNQSVARCKKSMEETAFWFGDGRS